MDTDTRRAKNQQARMRGIQRKEEKREEAWTRRITFEEQPAEYREKHRSGNIQFLHKDFESWSVERRLKYFSDLDKLEKTGV